MDKSRDTGPIVFAFALAGAPLLVRLLSPGIPEAGDGVLHYQFARWCWQHPALLLDLWAKPVFTLLASPFAQLGAWGVVLFNALCAGITAIAIGRIAQGSSPNAPRKGTGVSWLAPLLLLTAPVYFHTVMSGMTEVLFGAAAVGIVSLLLEQRIKSALILASFMPLMRPEWIAFVPCVLLYAAWRRAWRQLPWILLGSAVYAVFSFIVFGEPLRFFLRDPYLGVSAYGSGAADHFLRHMDEVLGMPLIVLLMGSLAIWPLLLWKSRSQRRTLPGMFLLTIVPAAGILIIHSYAWWKGGNGSLGLLRVLGTANPLVVLFVLHTGKQALTAWPAACNALIMHRRPVLASTVAVLAWVGIASLTGHIPMPVPQGADQELLLRTGRRVQELDTMGRGVMIQDPLITYAAGLDPFDSTRTHMIWGADKSQEGLGLETGDLLVWDAHFSPNEGGLPLQRVMDDAGMNMVEMLTPTEDQQVLGGHAMEVYIFRRLPGQRSVSHDTLYTLGEASPLVTRFDTVACGPKVGSLCFTAHEFPLTLEGLPLTAQGKLFDEIVLSGELEAPVRDTVSLFVAFAENEGNKQLRYQQITIKEASFRLRARVPPRTPGTTNKLYIWNRSRHPFSLRSLVLTRQVWEQH